MKEDEKAERLEISLDVGVGCVVCVALTLLVALKVAQLIWGG